MDPVIILDYDGVLADSFELHFAEFSRLCRKLRLHRLDSREVFRKIYEGDRLKQWLWAAVPRWLYVRLERRFRPRIEAVTRRAVPIEGMPHVVNELARRCPVYIITSNTTETTNWFLETYAITGVRDVLGADKGTGKVRKIRGVVLQHPDRTAYYVGDTKADMREARAAGALPIGAAWGYHDAHKLDEASPESIVDTPAMLRDLFLTPEDVDDNHGAPETKQPT